MPGTVKERLTYFLQTIGVNKSEFGRRIGVSSAFITSMRKSLQPDKIKAISSEFPNLNIDWLLTGSGEMLKGTPASDTLTPTAMKDIPLVPLYSLTAVAGFGNGADFSEDMDELLPWVAAQEGDFAIHVTGHSMEPRIPHGSDVLVRPYAYIDYNDLEFGRVHVVVTEDDRAMLKVIKRDKENPGNLRLISYNDDFPEITIPITSIRKVFLAVSVQAPL